MITKAFEVRNPLGLHARIAARVVRECRKFTGSLTVQKEGKSFDFKNITGVITCNAKCGEILTFSFDGEGEEEAAASLEKKFEERFGED